MGHIYWYSSDGVVLTSLATVMSSRHFLVDVIELYKDMPCLWKVSDPDYYNRSKRNMALAQLIELFKITDPNATKDTVIKKIASMRNCFKKEFNKVKVSLESGTDNIHVPKLWYYNLLTFLEDENLPRNSQTNESVQASMSFGYDEDCEGDSSEPTSNSAIMNSTQCQIHEVASNSAIMSSTQCQTHPQGLKRQSSDPDPVLEKVARRMNEHIENGLAIKPKQKHDSFGEYVAEKLRSLPPEMAIYCQKMVNDAIFLAETGNLNITSKIVTEQCFSPSSSYTTKNPNMSVMKHSPS